jgi:hypothetical protein
MNIWERLAKNKTDSEISFALNDIRETFGLHKDKPLDNPYIMRLNAERDALLTECSKRCIVEFNRKVKSYV